jgi:hypothetical protein
MKRPLQITRFGAGLLKPRDPAQIGGVGAGYQERFASLVAPSATVDRLGPEID